MISYLFEGLVTEIQTLFETTDLEQFQGIYVFKDTQFKKDEMVAFGKGAVVVSLSDSPTFEQLIGNTTQAEINWRIKAYFHDFNQALATDDGFSYESYEIIDFIRKHIAFGRWFSQDFKDICKEYSFNIILGGMDKADMLEHANGCTLGYMINLNSIAINTDTATNQEGGELEHIAQVTEQVPAMTVDHTSLSLAKTASSTVVLKITSNTPWILINTYTWLDLSDIQGLGSKDITITALSANTGTSDRTATLVLMAQLTNIADIDISVVQGH